jgi:hypothetical protein
VRARDLKKLKPGTRVKIALTKGELLDAPYLKRWTDRPTYFHKETEVAGWFEIRTSKKVVDSTQIEPFTSREIQLAKE